MANAQKNYKYYDFVMAAFVAVLICANAIGASKVATLFGFTLSAGVLFFPVSYIFGDILTEVYGYARTRRVVWAGFAAMAFMTLVSWLVIALPPAADWPHQAAFETVFGGTWRIAIASLIAYFAGEFTNSYILAKMKIATRGRFLWVRTIGSTAIGQAIDSLIFYPLAFAGIWSEPLLMQVMIGNYLFKVLWEVFATPFTYTIVNFLKRTEREDYYDTNTNFTPFSTKV